MPMPTLVVCQPVIRTNFRYLFTTDLPPNTMLRLWVGQIDSYKIYEEDWKLYGEWLLPSCTKTEACVRCPSIRGRNFCSPLLDGCWLFAKITCCFDAWLPFFITLAFFCGWLQPHTVITLKRMIINTTEKDEVLDAFYLYCWIWHLSMFYCG